MSILKIALIRMKPGWWELSEDQRRGLLGDNLAKLYEDMGVKNTKVLNIHWSCEEWHYIAIEEHRDAESLKKFEDIVMKTGWPRYSESKMFLGIETDAEEIITLEDCIASGKVKELLK